MLLGVWTSAQEVDGAKSRSSLGDGDRANGYGQGTGAAPDVATRPRSYPRSTLSNDRTGKNCPTIRSRVDEVYLLFIATNKRGKFVRDLKQTDFTILDDHKSPKVILSFRRETDLPLRLGVLMDVSGSVDSEFQFEQNAAVAFLRHTLRSNLDQAFIVGFNSENRLIQDFTDNVRLLGAAVHKLHAGGGTALYDAIYQACKVKFLNDHSDPPVRKAIIVVSDGEDNQSEISKAEAIEMAQRAQVIVYAISTNSTGLLLHGDRILYQIAEATGGRIFLPFQLMNIALSFRAIEDELRSQYAVSYTPASFEHDGRYRSIEISTTKKNLYIRSRTGYFTSTR